MNEESLAPRLRPVDAQPFQQNGRHMVFLRDPLGLSARMVAIPEPLQGALALADGTRTLYAIQAGLLVHFGLSVRVAILEQLFSALDDVYLLDNERSAAARRAALEKYRGGPFRPPSLAGDGYPADPGELRSFLDGHLAAVKDPADGGAAVRGLLSPHIDYRRGAPVYGAAWAAAATVAKAAALVVILGTDHSGGHARLTLTRRPYATPYGVLPLPTETLDRIAGAIGEEAAFEEELHHRREHSIELAVTWLHHMRGGQPVETLPILCGSFSRFSHGQADPAEEQRFSDTVDVLRDAMAGRRTLVVAAADLAHIGPAFGGDPVDNSGRSALRAADSELLDRMSEGDAAGFFRVLRAVEDCNNVCGLPPIYLALRLLGPVQGRLLSYDQCPADNDDTSWVSIAGMLWS